MKIEDLNKVIVIRHVDHKGGVLTEGGLAQLEKLKALTKEHGSSLMDIFSSTNLPCVQTAAGIALDKDAHINPYRIFTFMGLSADRTPRVEEALDKILETASSSSIVICTHLEGIEILSELFKKRRPEIVDEINLGTGFFSRGGAFVVDFNAKRMFKAI
jgi:phosphohistidine phosphatase SixA